MIKNDQNAETVFETDGITGKKLNVENGCEYVQLNIAANKEIEPHVLPMPVTFYVLNGNAELTINNEQVIAKKGDLIEVKAGSSRAWKNMGDEELVLLAIKHVGV